MLYHVSFGVSNIEVSSAFYDAVLAVLGAKRQIEGREEGVPFIGYGIKENDFIISQKIGVKPCPGIHIAFEAQSAEAVNQFYQVALEKGGQCNGAPGIREHYSPTYYAAFIIDPDGHHIEAVAHV